MKLSKNVVIIVLSLIFSVVESYAGRLKDFELYLTQIEELSEQKIPFKEEIKKDYKSKKYGERILSEEEKIQRHDDFKARKDKLIKEWEENTQIPWPKYNKKTECLMDGTCVSKQTGWRYDAHHIIPQSHNGPNEWWNLIPLDIRQHNLIHGTPIFIDIPINSVIKELSNSDTNIIDSGIFRAKRTLDRAYCCELFSNSCIVKEFGKVRGEY